MRTNREHWTGKMSEKHLGHGAHQQVLEAGPPMRAQYDKINSLLPDDRLQFGHGISGFDNCPGRELRQFSCAQ